MTKNPLIPLEYLLCLNVIKLLTDDLSQTVFKSHLVQDFHLQS